MYEMINPIFNFVNFILYLKYLFRNQKEQQKY